MRRRLPVQSKLSISRAPLRALRLAAQDAALSRRKHGFDSRRARQYPRLARRAVGLVGLWLATALLAACSGPPAAEDIAPAAAGAAVRDCREPAPLFHGFTARATAVARSPAKGKGGALLTVTLEFTNNRSWSAALSNSGNGIVYEVDFALTSAAGKVYAAKDITGDIAGKGIHTDIKPGDHKTGKLVFAVPRGNYSLTIERKVEGRPAASGSSGPAFACTIHA